MGPVIVRVLLDTHALIWWLTDSDRMPMKVRAVVHESANEVYVSAATAWEVATKARVGKLPDAMELAHDFVGQLAMQGFRELEVTVAHGQRAGSLPGLHKDPFDRMLIAQAQAENLVLVSNERIFDQYGVNRLWE